MIRLILGGEKSGKTDFGLSLLDKGPDPRLLLVTGNPMDLSFRAQIREHRKQRRPELPVREIARDLPETLETIATGSQETGGLGVGAKSVLVDSLDFWLFNVLSSESETGLNEVTVQGCALADDVSCALINSLSLYKDKELTIISSEIGFGPIPAQPDVRAFIRALGSLHQSVATASDEVYLVTAGLPLCLKKV